MLKKKTQQIDTQTRDNLLINCILKYA